MLKRVHIFLHSDRVGVAARLFEAMLSDPAGTDLTEADLFSPDPPEEDQSMDLFSEARLRLTADRCSLSYEESALTGMEDSEAQLSFQLDQPQLITLIRSGMVRTALVFEPGQRHVCTYTTPYMAFEVCVHTLSVDNRLKDGLGTLDLDYVIELRGAQAERCRMHLEIKE